MVLTGVATAASAAEIDTRAAASDPVQQVCDELGTANADCEIQCTQDTSGCLPVCPSSTQQACTDPCDVTATDGCTIEVCLEPRDPDFADCGIYCVASDSAPACSPICLPDTSAKKADVEREVQETRDQVPVETRPSETEHVEGPSANLACMDPCQIVTVLDDNCEPDCSRISTVDCGVPCESVKTCTIDPCTLLGAGEDCFVCTQSTSAFEALCNPVCSVKNLLGASTSEVCTVDPGEQIPREIVTSP